MSAGVFAKPQGRLHHEPKGNVVFFPNCSKFALVNVWKLWSQIGENGLYVRLADIYIGVIRQSNGVVKRTA
ncbi:hypothetical protein COCOBI_15-1110 [Coccomyxa sp. Obi]|nr:hypothetical protein COCOBI_15-1110 [Coccomyxa sp. Obi]